MRRSDRLGRRLMREPAPIESGAAGPSEGNRQLAAR